MKKNPDALYAVTERSHTGSLVKPQPYRVLRSDKVVRRIVLAPSIEEAIYLTYPLAYQTEWTMAKIKAYVIEPENRHSIHDPLFLQKGFDFKHAVEHNEYACFSNLRMKELGTIRLLRTSNLNTDLVDEEGNIYGKRFAIF